MRTAIVYSFALLAIFICPLAAHADATSSVAVHLSIRTATTTLYDADVSVPACEESASSTPALSGYCAVKASGLDSVWTPWGDMLFLESVQGVANDFSSGLSWNWFSDLEYGQTSLDEHVLSEGESLLVTIGRMPLKIALSTSTPVVGATTTVSVLEFGFDAGWNPAWLPASTTTVSYAGLSATTTASGEVEFVATSTDPFIVYAEKEGFIGARTNVSPRAVDVQTEQSHASSGKSGGGSSAPAHRYLDVAKAVSFLASNQRSDGSFGSDLYTDWAAIALSLLPYSSARDKAARYLESASLSGSVTDFERRAMALMSLGIDPRSGTSVDYIAKIERAFDGTQIGDASLVNDDIFALFPLLKSGFASSDDIIKKTVAFIVSRQTGEGSWEGSADLTSAAVQALSLVPSVDGVPASLSKARAYLAALPRTSGGFGNPYTTSWALQAIAAFGEAPSSWASDFYDPNDFLAIAQGDDGGVGDQSLGVNSRVWATAYAVPAALGKPWGAILSSFSRPVTTVSYVPATAPETREATSTTQEAVVATSTPALEPMTVFVPVPEARVSDDISKDEQTPDSAKEQSIQQPVVPPESLIAAAGAAEGTRKGFDTRTAIAVTIASVGALGAVWIIKFL